MDYEIKAKTAHGAALFELADRLSEQFAPTIQENDRTGRFPTEHLEALKETGFLYSPIPREYGGMGVETAHDVLVASSRLARVDPSITLGANMHIIAMMTYVNQHRHAKARGDAAGVEKTGRKMQRAVAGGVIIAGAVSEPNQDLVRMKTEAVRRGDGWVVSGRKIISSMAPGATHFTVQLTYKDDDGTERHGFMLIPRDAPGVTVHDDWDALGMRASGSVTVTFDNVPIGTRGPARGAAAGVISTEYLDAMLTSGPAHASASLGVAEEAQRVAVQAVMEANRRKGGEAIRSTQRHLAAENSIELGAARSYFSRALTLIDEYQREHLAQPTDIDAANAIFAEAQRMKTFVNQAAVHIVDRAMTMAGGSAFMAKHPLSRLYRDARAGAFMQPLGANLAYEDTGAVALGLRPTAF